jgi:hypothetical protein
VTQDAADQLPEERRNEQGKTWAAFIQRELEAERDRRKILDARGAAVVTTAGSLTTLLAAVGAFVSGRGGFRLPPTAVGPLTLTLIALSVAALCGIVITTGRLYKVASPAQMTEMLTERWPIEEADARNQAAQFDRDTIESLRTGNESKANWLRAALGAQLFGLVTLTYTVYLILGAAS